MNRAELVKALELIKPALATDGMVPIFQSFMFKDGTISAYNDKIAIVGPTEYDGACAIHGTTLLGLLSASKAEELSIDLAASTATIKCGKSTSKLPYSTEDDFIFELPTDKWECSLSYNASFHEAVSVCLESVSTDETQQALHGITVHGDRLYSCNGDTLTRINLKKGIGKKRYLMPTAFCTALSKLWSSMDMVKGTLNFNDEWVFADFDVWAIYGRILKIDDPIDFEGLIKKTIKSEPTLLELPNGFSDALSRARVLADPESKKTQVTINAGKIQLYTETPMGEIKDTLTFKGHPDAEANINASHVQHAIDHCDKIGFLENCTVLEKDDNVFMLVSNM